MYPGHGAVVIPYVPAIVGDSTNGVDDLCLQVESFLSKEFLEDTMNEEEAEALRSNECIEVTVHGQTTEKFSIKKLEEKLQVEHGSRRIVVPSTDILHHKARSGFPLDVTHQEAMEDLMDEFNKIYKPREDMLRQEEAEIDRQLKSLKDGTQTEKEVLDSILRRTESIVVFGTSNKTVKRKLEQEIGVALGQSDPGEQKAGILESLGNILQEGAQIQILTKTKSTKAKWGAMNNRRGEVGENKVALAMNQVMEEFGGMSVVGMKTHSYLYDFLERLNIKLTYSVSKNAKTKKVEELDEVEHDHISTWLEEDALVVNLVQCKTMEVKPWAPPDQARRGEAALEHAKHGLLQILKDTLTFKELLPDVLMTNMKKIR